MYKKKGYFPAEEVEVKEGTWAIPKTVNDKNKLKDLLKKPIKLGKDGDDASKLMYSIIGDDELLDDLYVAGKKNPNGDARPLIKIAMKRLGIKEDLDEILTQRPRAGGGRHGKNVEMNLKVHSISPEKYFNLYLEGLGTPILLSSTPEEHLAEKCLKKDLS